MQMVLFPLFALLAQARPLEKPTAFAQSERLAIQAAAADRDPVPRFSRMELTLDLRATYANPFDPEEIDVHAIFQSPAGRRVTVNGFLSQSYARRLENGEERLIPRGKPVWKIRFAPNAVGTWRCKVVAKDRSGTVQLNDRRFKVIRSTDHGFIERSRRSPSVFAYRPEMDGAGKERPFVPVGENMCWAGSRGTYDFEDWLAALSSHGGNWIRLWMRTNGGAIEWTHEGRPEQAKFGYPGLGAYSLDNAWKVDEILDVAEKNHVAVMLCLGTYGEFTVGGFFNEGQWKANPYNAANGGPCATPDEFWTNPTARKLYQRRLRYLAARYGSRVNLHSWEFWNEANAPVAWVGEMARCMKGVGEFAGKPVDPYGHLVSTSYGSDAIWKLPEIDFTMTHHYGTGEIPDHAPVIHGDALGHRLYAKPHLMAEYGIDWRAPDSKYDPRGDGINLHNGLWASVCSGNAGTAMLWWWDNYVAPEKLYGPFQGIRKFVDAVDWTAAAWNPIELDPARSLIGSETFTDLTVAATSGWGKSPVREFTMTPQGAKGGLALPQFLYGPAKPDLRASLLFHVKFERPGRFTVRVNTVSDRANLRVVLDDKPAKEWMLSAVPPGDGVKPEYESTELKKDYGVYQARFNKDYGVDVSAGAHTILLENAAGDWLSVESYMLTGYRSSLFPDLNIYGVSDGTEAVVWVQNARHNWKNAAENRSIPRIGSSETRLHGLQPGRYAIAWWDTARGTIVRNEVGVATAVGLALRLPSIDTDVAMHIVRVR